MSIRRSIEAQATRPERTTRRITPVELSQLIASDRSDPLEPMRNSLDGVTLGEKYLVGRVIGVGGMGVVCEAQHATLGKRFAVKLVARALRTEMMAARFRREVRAVSAIESDHIVQVFDVGLDDRFGLYMVMEYLVGEDLADRLHRDKRLDPYEAVQFAQQIGRALARAHAARIIHRDLKPGNVFLTRREDGTTSVKLLDFGISKLIENDPSQDTWAERLTQTGTPVGTAQYMSPEQAQAREDVDERTDVWALGVVLYEMLAGRPAYPPARNHAQTMLKVMTERPQPLERLAPWVPRAIAQVVEDALQHDLKKRIPSADALVERLADAIDPAKNIPSQSGELAEDEPTCLTKPYILPPMSARPSDDDAETLDRLAPISGAKASPSSTSAVASPPSDPNTAGHVAPVFAATRRPHPPRARARVMALTAGLFAAIGVAAFAGHTLEPRDIGAAPPVVFAAPASFEAPPPTPPPAHVAEGHAGEAPREAERSTTGSDEQPSAGELTSQTQPPKERTASGPPARETTERNARRPTETETPGERPNERVNTPKRAASARVAPAPSMRAEPRPVPSVPPAPETASSAE